MKNLMRGHIYHLKKDKLFFGCLAFSLIFLASSLRLTFALASELIPVTGIETLMSTFLSGDIVLYAFMLLTANIITETYRSGVMKNIISHGIAKKQYYFSIVLTVSAAYLLTMLVNGMIAGVLAFSKYGMGTISYPAYYALSVIARALFALVYISFAATTTIYTRNTIAGFISALIIPNIPQILEMALRVFKIQIDLDFIKTSTHMPSTYAASNDLWSFLPCFIVLCGYFILSVFFGLKILKQQDIK